MWGRLTAWIREQLRLTPDLKHLNDGTRDWHHGDDVEDR